MTEIKETARVAGSLFSLEALQLLDDDNCNALLVSDRTLYLMQRFALNEVNWWGRYASEYVGSDGYIPVLADSDDGGVVDTIARMFRLEIEDMSCDIVGAINELTVAIAAAQNTSCCTVIGTDVETTDGQEGGGLPDPVNGIAYESATAIDDRKCLAANYIHMSIRDAIKELADNNVDSYAYAGLSGISGIVAIIIGGAIAGPFGALIGGVIGLILTMSTMIFKATITLDDIYDLVIDNEDDAVCSLYTAVSSSGAKAAYEAYLSGAGATSLQVEFVGLFLTTNLLNLLFFAWGDSETAIEAITPVSTCGGCDWQHTFDFTIDEQGWTNDAMGGKPFGVYVPGVGWSSVWGNIGGTFDERLFMRLLVTSTSVNFTYIRNVYTLSGACGGGSGFAMTSVAGAGVLVVAQSPLICGTPLMDVDNTGAVLDPTSFRSEMNGAAASDGAANFILTSVVLSGTGDDPF